jgi:hypothetical protein
VQNEIQRLIDGRAKVEVKQTRNGFTIGVNQNYNLEIEVLKGLIMAAGVLGSIKILFF